ncbi:MAG: class I SAM-dependent methyltransferase [bacterium]|nr:class I SAM-dependent methyltransferase [bacterium]
MTQDKISRCPLCHGKGAAFFFEDAARSYFRCRECLLIHVPEAFWPTRAAERARYDQHRNSPNDPGYVRFLDQLAEPLAGLLPEKSRGLDYGCGPAPVLCERLRARGHEVHPYDPFYFSDPPEGPFGFITSTETFEHFRNPRGEIEKLRALLSPGGLLGVMTTFWEEALFKGDWHYRRDPTHLCFYRRESFDFIAAEWGFRILFCDDSRTLILQKE